MMAEAPAGTVTFLFTDIEGSTRLWESDPGAMKEALARHDTILRQIFENQNGYVFKTVGDAFYVAFASPADAVQGALAAQRALLQEPWGETPIRVRMGLHSGETEERGGDYFGPPLNRVARLMSAGHGGQILISQATRELLLPHATAGVELRDMGRHSLKDLPQPEHIFQVVAPGLPVNFPSLRTLNIKLHNLPSQVTPFIGRETEISEIQELLSPSSATDREVRLLTLTGPGGTGKTRLALQVASKMAAVFENGAYFVDLSSVRDPALVLPAIERVLEVRQTQGQHSLESTAAHLSGKQMLLVLDNFEQVMPAADDIAGLLSTAPDLKILVTSRLLLRVYGEVGYEVPSLRVPDLDRLPASEQLAQYESVRLFSEQARAVKSGFTINSQNAAVIAEICQRLDGLPLAIELAAARVRLLTPQQILKQLDNRLRFLSGGARNLPARQQTLQGAIDWSFDLLEPEEQVLFRRLGIFTGGCTYEAIETVCNYAADLDILGILETLIDHSLIARTEADEEPHFVMLQVIHDYASKKLQASGELDELRGHHLAFFSRQAEEAEPYLELSEQNIWLDRLEREHDNFSAAFRSAIDFKALDQGISLAQGLRLFWFARGYLAEGRRLLSDIIVLPMEDSQRAILLDTASFLARYHGDYAAAEKYISEGLSIAQRREDWHAHADALANAGFVYLHQNQLQRAEEAYSEALSFYQAQANEQGTADASIHLGLIAFNRNDYAAAQHLYERSLAIWQRLGDRQGIVYARRVLGDVTFQQGNYVTAENYYRASLTSAVEIGFQMVIAQALEGLAYLAVVEEDFQRTFTLAGSAARLRKEANIPVIASGRQFMEHILQQARNDYGEEAADAAWNDGMALSLDAAVSYALVD